MKAIITQTNPKKTVAKTLFNFMKTGTLAFALTLFVNHALSQTLEFSQVKLVTAEETVPVGKVWKITGVMPNTRMTSAAGQTSASASIDIKSTEQSFKVNGETIYYATSDSKGRTGPPSTSSNSGAWGYSSSSVATINSLSLWIPENTTLESSTGIYAVSVIEFTVQ